MKHKFGLLLAAALITFPQIVETIYSPALPHIALNFSVPAELAAQTLSLYFLAFALGVVVWGYLCDRIGRRPVMLSGLSVYGIASVIALLSSSFSLLMVARMLSAFGAAVGSIGTQTMLRDVYQGKELTHVFSIMGIALAASPVIGMTSGAALVSYFDYQGIFVGLAVLAILLVGWSVTCLPETRPKHIVIVPLWHTISIMIKDASIWRAALLVALFNICLFSYYQIAPFDFKRLGLSTEMFGYSGWGLAFGAALGSLLNKYLLSKGWSSNHLVVLAALLTLIGAAGVTFMASTWRFTLPMILVVLAYGVAIPNILATALTAYPRYIGTAGALLGLLYYLMLGSGLVVAGWSQNLGWVLIFCGSFALLFGVYTCLIASETRCA